MYAAELLIDEYKKYIERDFPNFKVNEIKYLGSGWDNAAFLVNNEYVFRFLRGLFERNYPLKTEEIEKEVNILKRLAGKTSFAVPKPDYVGRYYSYFGYKSIPGALWDQTPNSMTDEYLKSWVAVRSELSKAIPVAEAGALKIPSYRTDKNQQFVNQFLADGGVDERVKQMAKAAMDYVCAQCQPKDSWVFIHEDLQMSNCMVNPAAKKITGVIDWLEAEIGPLEAEFYFWSKYGHEMLEKVAKMQEDFDGTKIDINLAVAIHQFYIVADYQDFKSRGFDEAAQHKWEQIEAYI